MKTRRKSRWRWLMPLCMLMVGAASGCQILASVDESRLAADADLNESVFDASDDLLDAGSRDLDAALDAGAPSTLLDARVSVDGSTHVADASVSDASVSPKDVSPPVQCTNDEDCPQPNGPCQRSHCQNGACTLEPEPDGSSCVTDKCIVDQTCTAGRCLGGFERDCGDLDSECISGACDPQSGACVAEPLPKGTDCSTEYCKVDERCDGNGRCESGTDRICPNVGCDTQKCSDKEQACVTDKRGCEIDNMCVADGSKNPANECEECDPKKDPRGWSPRENGSRCDDGLSCTKKDECSAGVCLGEDDCRRDEYCSAARNRCVEEDDD